MALLALLAKALALTALPLAYVYFSRGRDRFRALAWITAFLTLDLIMFGAFTRLTDSGLGCPDWPGCYGHSNPLSAGEPIRAAETAMPSGPVTMTKAWIEMLHRYFAMAVGALIIVLFALAWRRRRREPERTPWLAAGILFAVCLQGAFGAWTVTMKLQPAIVTLHLLGGMTLFALLVWLAMREQRPATMAPAARSLRPFIALAMLLLVVQIALGGWVSTNYAVMACPDFPLCLGQWKPGDLDFRAGFTLWRDLGMDGDGEPIVFQALVAIHWLHRTFALVVFAVLGWVAWRGWSLAGLSRLARMLAALLVLQFVTGLSNIVLQWPLALAVLHTGGAAVLLGILVACNVRVWRAVPATVAQPALRSGVTGVAR
ncbi:MAG TPA: COX15/CtaA family protein [Burkholderiaceae bacterium]|nr:COX15/CtaA family protein [Burkholderiaceae bacterium]